MLFAQLGYQRTTIRRIAAVAKVDPGLVMHYFGSKQALFTRAAEHAPEEFAGGTPGEVTDSMLAMVRERLSEEPVASLALLRSMLTHDDAADTYRGATASRLNQIAETIPGADAALRASLLISIIQGVIVQRWLLGPSPLADAAPNDVIELLRPCFEALMTPAEHPAEGTR
jgi:AcrR family transcriptional regulator